MPFTLQMDPLITYLLLTLSLLAVVFGSPLGSL